VQPRADTYYERGYHSTHQRPLFEDDAYFRARAELALEYFTEQDRRGRVFDYGCGLGASIYLLANAQGWDISPEARGRARERGIRVFDSLLEAPRAEYDVVLCRHVLEHLEDPLASLWSMRELLRPTGTMILVLPKEGHWTPSSLAPDRNQHLYCWTPRTIANLLWRAQLAPQSIEYRYPFGARRLMPVRRVLGARAYHAARRVGAVFRRNGEMVVRARPSGRVVTGR
jgi:SAM-dependent methyltransferase